MIKNTIGSARSRRLDSTASLDEQVAQLEQRLVGQTDALARILPYVHMHQAGLAPENRPVGVFLLLGPTGTGKTRTVEVLAESLHGSDRTLLRVDCGEFQMEHEVAKLIGAPPGYLGHRETQPMLNQQKLNAATSEYSNLSIVLFDEIEKAASSLQRLLLGVLDKAALKLGDNSSVNFERSLIFMTSNLGARSMMRELHPDFGFEALIGTRESPDITGKLQKIGMSAVRRKFSPEFVNRIDGVVTYQPLSQQALAAIVEHQLFDLQQHINKRLGPRAFRIATTRGARAFLLRTGTSIEYGARELKRVVLRHITQPLAAFVSGGRIEPGSRVTIDVDADGESLRIQPQSLLPSSSSSSEAA
ncbi:MAG TPA: AAA family ATPase [Bryobacteraceae bacterium]